MTVHRHLCEVVRARDEDEPIDTTTMTQHDDDGDGEAEPFGELDGPLRDLARSESLFTSRMLHYVASQRARHAIRSTSPLLHVLCCPICGSSARDEPKKDESEGHPMSYCLDANHCGQSWSPLTGVLGSDLLTPTTTTKRSRAGEISFDDVWLHGFYPRDAIPSADLFMLAAKRYHMLELAGHAATVLTTQGPFPTPTHSSAGPLGSETARMLYTFYQSRWTHWMSKRPTATATADPTRLETWYTRTLNRLARSCTRCTGPFLDCPTCTSHGRYTCGGRMRLILICDNYHMWSSETGATVKLRDDCSPDECARRSGITKSTLALYHRRIVRWIRAQLAWTYYESLSQWYSAVITARVRTRDDQLHALRGALTVTQRWSSPLCKPMLFQVAL